MLKRKMQFVAGPEKYEWFACGEHKHHLETGDVMNFIPIPGEPAKMCDEEDVENYDCDFHREG